MKIIFNDGKEYNFDCAMPAIDIAKAIDQDLYKAALAAEIDGKLCGMFTMVDKDCTVKMLTFADEGGRWTFRHTASHILAHAVKNLFPDVFLAIGPAIETGFYYDFDSATPFTLDMLGDIEAEMNKIVKQNLRLERFTLPRDEAIALMTQKNEPYKVELIQDLPEDEEISFYKQGDFVDLCAGPHLGSTGKVKNFKLLFIAGAYWRGNEKNKMLQRIYATAFDTKQALEEHINKLDEAKKRDHNKLGRELGYFTTVDEIGQGLPIIMHKGAKVIQTLQRFVEDEQEKRGYELTRTPLMAKSDLYKISGHWDHYKDGMFVLGDEDSDQEVFALRPMTCPFQFQAYLASMHSYRDLPIRYQESATLFRNESSGEMHGLIRVRQFTISEGHLACTPSQLESEFKGCVDLANYMLKTLGLEGDVTYRFSKWDPNNKDKYIGDADEWERVQDVMREILQHMEIDFKEAEGEAAFYGPKLDIQIRNVFGKEDTMITIQIDFQLAQRFNMVYVDSDGSKKHPYIIHRTSIGCYERTLALLIEKYAGAMPTWLAPEQVRVMTLTERTIDVAEQAMQTLKNKGILCTLDDRNEKIGFKIREAQMQKIPYMLVIGDKEAEAGLVAVRSRKLGDLGTMALDDFINNITEEIVNKVNS